MAEAAGGGGGAAAAAPASSSGGAPAGQSGSQGGQSAPAAERGRIGDFSNWSGQHETSPAQQITLQDPSLVGRGEPDAPFEGFEPSWDAQAQALAVDDSQQAEVMSEADAAKWRAEYDSWKSADDLPEPFMQKFGTVTIDGQRYRIPVSEAFQGYQRQSDYSMKLREVYKMRDQVQSQFQGLQRLMSDLDDGQRFLDAMVAIKKFPGFHQAAIIYGKQLDAEQRMTPEQRAVIGQNRALRAETQRLNMVNQQLQQQVQQVQQQVQQPSRSEQMLFNQLAQIVPKAAELVRWVDSPAARREFELHMENMLPSLEGKDITTEFVASVMQAAMQSIQAHLQAGQEQPLLAATNTIRPAPARPPAPPNRVGNGPAPSSQNGNGQMKRARIGDLGMMVGRRQ